EGVARQSLISSALEHIAPEIPIARCPFAFLDARRHVLHLLPGIRRMLVSVFFEKIGTIKQRADIQIERKRYQPAFHRIVREQVRRLLVRTRIKEGLQIEEMTRECRGPQDIDHINVGSREMAVQRTQSQGKLIGRIAPGRNKLDLNSRLTRKVVEALFGKLPGGLRPKPRNR